jgi:hypothetical protein
MIGGMNKKLLQAAEKGNADSQFNLGNLDHDET